ncbi:DUF5063 domain-containing protein [Marmoricola endophyticus]|uniref:DUF5063 domain-containing protein n=1 Tax=Marmoricola endophyticus TaxID=2040280 RepID=A0A917BPB1_9ACTN|nr:DUF5063 domain-containing protein [Marmoricola endophyticus]GGF49030.1 DUF5063 domain-containing protein [Marmoricola endophyticus]
MTQGETALDAESRQLAEEVAASVADFLQALRAIAREATPGTAVPLLLVEISQVLLTGARLGAQREFTPRQRFQPDVGPEADVDDLRLRLAELLGDVDTYSFVFEPYEPEIVESQLSDDLATMVADLENGLRHYRNGDVGEALWWWQFSYVSSWGNLAGAALNALLSVVSHSALDAEIEGEDELVDVASSVLDSAPPSR